MGFLYVKIKRTYYVIAEEIYYVIAEEIYYTLSFYTFFQAKNAIQIE